MMRWEKAAHCDMEEQLVLIINILVSFFSAVFFSKSAITQSSLISVDKAMLLERVTIAAESING